MDENSSVESVAATQLPAQQAAPKKITRLLLFGGLGIAVIAIIVLSVYYFSVSGNKKSAYQDTVYKEYYQGNFAESAKQAKEGLKKSPDDPFLLKSVIDSNSSLGNQSGREKELFEQSKPYIEHALKTQPNNAEILLSIGYAYETSGDYKQALNYYEKAILLNDKSGVAHFHRGHALEFVERKKEALTEYEKAYDLDPNNAQVLMGKARVAASKNDLESSIAFFQKAAEAKDVSLQTKAEALTGAALVKESQVIYMKEATGIAFNAVSADPHYSPALGVYGHLLSINGNPHDGMYYLNLAIKENPRIVVNYWHGGVVLRTAKDYNNAIKYLNAAIEKVPNDNTLIDYNTKKRTIGLLYYDLARTYAAENPTNPYIIQSLKNSLSSDPTLKEKIKNDNQKYNIFSGLTTNTEFSSLME